MTRLDEGRLRAYRDGELSVREKADVEGWLHEDPKASATLEAMGERDRQITGLLSVLDGAAPTERVRQNLHARFGVGAAGSGPSAGRAARGWLRAAGLVLFLAGGVSAAVPGSPVRDWVTSLLPSSPEPPLAEVAVVEQPAEAGFMIEPVDGVLNFELIDVEPGTSIRASIVTDRRAAFFASQSTRVEIEEATGSLRAFHESGDVRIAIPNQATKVSLYVNGRLYLLKDGSTLDVSVPTTERSDREIVFSALE